jgi:hypothetical protein
MPHNMTHSTITPTLTQPQVVFNLRGWNPRPAFLVEPGWIPRIFSLSMASHWRQVSYPLGRRSTDGHAPRDLDGISYFLMPAPTPGSNYSAHYDPDSPYFFSFFGLYVIPPVNGERVSPRMFAELGNRDNLAWLRSMGDPNPTSQPIMPLLTELTADVAEGEQKWSFLANYAMHGDLGTANPQENFPEVLMPPDPAIWRSQIASYQNVTMICRGFLWYEGDYLVMNFFNGVEFTNQAGQRINTYENHPEFREQLQRMAAGIRIMNDGRSFVAPNSGSLAHW